MIELRKFRNKYNLELLLNSDEKLKIGDLIQDPIFAKPYFDDGKPTDIWRILDKANIITDDEKREFREKSNNIELINANLLSGEKKVSFDFSLDLKILEKFDLGELAFDFGDETKFSFTNIKKREITDDIAEDISDYLDDLIDNNWKDCDFTVRRTFMITELYYGDLSIKIDEKLKTSFNLSLAEIGVDVGPKLKTSTSLSYIFSSKNIPFAAKLTKLKDYNA